MLSRQGRTGLVAVVLALATSGCDELVTEAPAPQTASQVAEGPPPNVLFIVADDLSSSLGSYGHPIVQSPNIDRLANEGVRFDRAYNQYPLCNPSRASMLTGLRPDAIRVFDLTTHFRDNVPDVVTLPQHFRNHGYHTSRIGKVFHIEDRESWDERISPGPENLEGVTIVNPTPWLAAGSSPSWGISDAPDEDHRDARSATEAIRILERERDRNRPFFLAVGFHKPHAPYVAPRKYFDWYPLETIPALEDPTEDLRDVPRPALISNPPNYGVDRASLRHSVRGYYASISFIDAQVGRLLEALERTGLRENTIVVFVSDHGYHLGEKGQWMKRTLFETGARQPLIIAGPGIAGNTASKKVVELLDLYPTLVDLAGLPANRSVEGRSLRPLLVNPRASWPRPTYTQVLRSNGMMGRSIRSQQWRYTEWDEGRGGAEFYNTAKDPEERINLIDDPAFASEIRRLRTNLRANSGAL